MVPLRPALEPAVDLRLEVVGGHLLLVVVVVVVAAAPHEPVARARVRVVVEPEEDDQNAR